MSWNYLFGIGAYVLTAVAGSGALAAARRHRRRKPGGRKHGPRRGKK